MDEIFQIDLSVIVALFAVSVSAIAALINLWTLKAMKKHNVKSVTPILHIVEYDNKSFIKVLLSNRGVGPGLIKSIVVSSDKNEEKNNILDHFSDSLPDEKEFKEGLTKHKDLTILHGSDIVLLELYYDYTKQEQVDKRELIRSELRQLTIHVSYEDIYGNPMKDLERKLDVYAKRSKSPVIV